VPIQEHDITVYKGWGAVSKLKACKNVDEEEYKDEMMTKTMSLYVYYFI